MTNLRVSLSVAVFNVRVVVLFPSQINLFSAETDQPLDSFEEHYRGIIHTLQVD